VSILFVRYIYIFTGIDKNRQYVVSLYDRVW